MGIYEIVVILSAAAYKQLKKAKSTVSLMMTCNQMFQSTSGAVAFWWKGRPLMPYQETAVTSLIEKVKLQEVTEYYIVSTSLEKDRAEQLGSFSDHSFKVLYRTTLEVNDAH